MQRLTLFVAGLLFLSSCVTSSQDNNRIVEFLGVNKVVIRMQEPLAPGEKIHFYRVDCRPSNVGKTKKCISVPTADGVVVKEQEPQHYLVNLEPGGHIDAFALLRRHEATDRH